MLTLFHLLRSSSLLVFSLLAFTAIAQESYKKDEPNMRLKKCILCVPPECIPSKRYKVDFKMTLAKTSEPTVTKRYTDNPSGDVKQAKLTADFNTLGGVNTNGSVSIFNVLDGDFLVSVNYAQTPPSQGKKKRDPVTVYYKIGKNQECYRDMPKNFHTKDVQAVSVLIKRS